MILQKPWYVYVVRCSDGTLYTGITPDVESRLKAHNIGKGAKYTQGRGPVKLMLSEQWENRSEASVRESELKKLTHQQKERLIHESH